MKTLILLTSILIYFSSWSQISVDTTFSFGNEPNKKFSYYIPSSYSSSTSNPMMVALHPWNVNRWDSESWRDTLVSFAESNQLILICPDGGSDGQIDDSLDQEFTSAMIDSMAQWYNIDQKRTYCMGFSWGGKTTYIYGLKNSSKFCGLMPIGSTANIREVSWIPADVTDKPIYVIHGSLDFPNDRFQPLVLNMVDRGAAVNQLLMNGIDHTIDFPNRNKILEDAYQWMDSVCLAIPAGPNSIETLSESRQLRVFPNPVRSGENVNLTGFGEAISSVEVYDMKGKIWKEVTFENGHMEFAVPIKKGSYLIRVVGENSSEIVKVSVLE